MQSNFQPGAKVRVKGAEPVGTVESNVEGYVSVRYDHRPGVQTFGYYPEAHLEAVTPAPAPAAATAERSKPRASAKDILPQPAVDRV